MACHCHRCEHERPVDPGEPMMFGQPLRLNRMFLCAKCGNKRCPRAADHRNACSNSNEPGQRGSLYENAPGIAQKGDA